MRRFACTVLFTCGLLVFLAAQSLAYYQKATAEESAKSRADQTPPAAKSTAKTPPPKTPAPKVNVKAPQINVRTPQVGVSGAQIGVTSPQVRTTAPRTDRTAPNMGGTAQPLPRGPRGNVHDPYYDGSPRGAGMGVYVPMQVPPRETEEAPPAYGNVAAPAPAAPAAVAIPAYDAGDAKPKDAAAGQFAVPMPAAAADTPAAPPPAAAAAAAPAPTQVPLPAQLFGRFAGVQGRTLHTWEFRQDGTFEHAWTAAGNASGAASVEAGTFSIVGPYLTLAVWGRAAARPAAPARGSQQIRRLRLGMLGPGAGNAILLDGVMLKPQNE